MKEKTTDQTVKAVFKGADGSLGYETHHEYTLIIRHKGGQNISIEKIEGGGKCEYESMLAFLRNWDTIRVENLI